VFLLAAVFFVACNGSKSESPVATQTQKAVNAATPYPDGARRVTIEELEKLIAEGKAFIVDVRTRDSFDAAHIPNAKLIPEAEIASRSNELPRDKTIVTYCS
jgi:3-mercaptopyruvate sulfurtransferase SseA